MKFFVSSCSNLVALNIFLLVTAETCDAIFCQAVNGVYRERANDPGALESPASVNLSYPYQLELVLDPTTTTTTGNDTPDPDWVAQTLQHHIADALVFTLFDDCRVDATDKMAPVNLLKIAVQVEQSQTSHPNDYYTAHIEAVGDAAVADSEQVLAHQRLENAIRIVLMSHHVARFSVQPGAILTLKLPLPSQAPPHLVQGPQDDDNNNIKEPTHITKFVAMVTVACIGTIAAVLLVVAIQSRRMNGDRMIILPIHHRYVHFVLPGEDSDDQDDVELACSDKPTSKLIMLDPTETETEISESSSSEHEDW